MEKKQTKDKEKVKETKKVTPEKETKKEEKVEVKKTSKTKKEMSKETKEKVFKGVGIVVLVLAILGMAFWVSSSYGEDTAAFQFEYIDIDTYLEYLNDDEKRIILLARPDCSWCQLEEPIIKSVGSKNKLTIYYLDATPFLSNIEEDPYTEDGKTLIASDEDWFNGGFGTPNTLIVQNGKIIDGVDGYVERSELEDLFERNGFM